MNIHSRPLVLIAKRLDEIMSQGERIDEKMDEFTKSLRALARLDNDQMFECFNRIEQMGTEDEYNRKNP